MISCRYSTPLKDAVTPGKDNVLSYWLFSLTEPSNTSKFIHPILTKLSSQDYWGSPWFWITLSLFRPMWTLARNSYKSNLPKRVDDLQFIFSCPRRSSVKAHQRTIINNLNSLSSFYIYLYLVDSWKRNCRKFQLFDRNKAITQVFRSNKLKNNKRKK